MSKCVICNEGQGIEKIFLYQNSLRREVICDGCQDAIRVANKV